MIATTAGDESFSEDVLETVRRGLKTQMQKYYRIGSKIAATVLPLSTKCSTVVLTVTRVRVCAQEWGTSNSKCLNGSR